MLYELNKKEKMKHILIYYMIPFTAGFLLLQFIVYYPFISNGKSFIWNSDGINQHYPALVYYGRFLKNLLAGKEIPLLDFNIGMGFDTLTTLNYYAIGDPLALLAVFGKDGNTEGLYHFLIILRLYLAGISYLLYCSFRKQSSYPSVLGSFIYVFCGYVFFAGTRHPYFINPLIYLPLLFLGIELILQKKKPYLFILMIFISAVSNFYFLYMLTIIIFIYAVHRFFCTYDKNSPDPVWKIFLGTAFRTGLFYLLGIIMSAVILFPVLAAFLNNGRFDAGYDVNLLHYTLGYYITFINSFIAPNVTPGFWTQCTFAAIIPAAVLVVFRNSKYRRLRAVFLIGTISLLIPFIGYLMNGFSYVSNRWEFGYSFLIAFLFTSVYEDLFHLNNTDKLLLAAGTILYGVMGFFNPSIYILYAFLILCFTIACIFVFNRYTRNIYLQRTVMFALVFLNLGLNGYLTYSGRFGNYVGEFIASGKADKTIENSAVSMVDKISDSSFYRVEVYGDKQYNESMLLGFRDVSGYFSIMDKRLSEYMAGLELVSQRASYRFDNMDYRVGLSTLAGVKYLVTSAKEMVPYGYQLINKENKENKTYYLYENQFSLPLGYGYQNYVSRKLYETLNPFQKQEIMLRAAVLDEPADPHYKLEKDAYEAGNEAATGLKSEELPVTIRYGKGITQEEEYINVSKTGDKITVYFKGAANSETYLRLKNFNINNTKYYAMNVRVKNENDIIKTVYARSDRNNAYFGKEDYVINLGYQVTPMKSCQIIFTKPGRFHLGDLQVYTMPMTEYEKQIKEREKSVLENVQIGNNRITGTYNSNSDSLLCLSIPYSKGWKAYVNGEKTELVPANIMYMALPLKAGEHEIKLYYETPFLKTGIVVSASGGILFLCLGLYYRIKKNDKGYPS